MAADRESLVRRIGRLSPRSESDVASDAALLGRFITSRDEPAFAALVDRHGPMVLHVCRRILGDAHDAEDAFQATFLVLARKAAAVQPREALMAWLHGVARRVALKARAARARRGPEVGLPHRPLAEVHPDPLSDLTARELLDLVDAEVRRLPEAYRLPVILCCLEGRTQDEAARQLGWTPGSVRGRLERGRARLHSRLARRGLTLSAALAAAELSRGVGSAAVVARWAAPTVGAAMAFAAGRRAGGGISLQAAALAGGVVREMALAKLKAPVVLLLAGCLLATVLAAHQASDPPRPPTQVVRSSPPPSEVRGERGNPVTVPDEAAGPWPEEATRPIRVSGRVLDPSGRPLPGARLYVGYAPRRCDLNATSHQVDFPVRATSGADGRFGFTFARSELDERYLDASRPVVVAVADGFGLDWAELGDPAALKLQLVEDVPLEGRILDRAGRPVAGARVFVRELSGDLAGGLAHYVQNDDRSFFRNCRGPLPGLPPHVTTGPDGRFRLTGVGRERLVTLALEGPGITHAELTVATTATPLPRRTRGASFDYVAQPTRPIRGVVRDKATGRPVAGVKLSLEQIGPTALTDGNGRYELHCYRLPNYTVMAQPQGGEPYFAAAVRLTDQPGTEPLTADFELVGGIPLRGRVTDWTTGKPPRRAVVAYYPLFPNPHSATLTTYIRMAPSSAPVRPDGSYTLTVLPGPGAVLVAASPRDLYASALLDDRALADLVGDGADRGRGSSILTAAGDLSDYRDVGRFNAVALIKPDGREQSLSLDLTVQPARPVRGTVVGPDGVPLTGVRVSGLTPANDAETLEGPSFAVEGLNPLGRREVSFHHPHKGLGQVVTVRGDGAESLTVRLEPCGVVTGRAVDRAGHPVPGVILSFMYGVAGMDVTATTDRDGRFRASLVPGQQYSLGSSLRLLPGLRVVVEVGSGGSKDLGDIPLDR